MLQLLINALLTYRLFVIITWSSQMYWQVGLDLSMIPEFSETLLFLPLLETSFPQITTSLGMGATHLWGIDVEQIFFCYEQYVYFQLYRAISIFYSSHFNSSLILLYPLYYMQLFLGGFIVLFKLLVNCIAITIFSVVFNTRLAYYLFGGSKYII